MHYQLKLAKNSEINTSMKKAFFILCPLFFFSSLLQAKETPLASKSSTAVVVNKIIAAVGSEAILKSDLDSFESRLKKDGSIDEALLLDKTLEELKKSKSEQLQYLIREKMVESEIKRLNLSFTDDRVNEEISTLAKRNRMSRTELEAYMKKQGYSLTEYKNSLKARLERQSFFETEIVAKLRITDEDAYNEYKNKNPNYKPNINEYKIAQIFFDPRKGSPEEALKRAEAVYDKIKNGEAFDKLADKFNEDKGANVGGYLGQFKTGEFNADMERAISNLDAGGISQIVQTKQGFHIIKVLEKKVTQDPLFLRYKEQIKASLVEKNFKRQLKNWFESQKQNSYIQIYE